MDGFEVPVEALRKACRAGGAVVDGLAALPMAEAVGTVEAALPGGAAGAAAAALAAAWRSQLRQAADALARHTAALRAAAECYDAAEHQAVASLRGER